jgi:phosphoribosyl 1,2-cyclic phosphate phosphodiesterase
LKKKFTFLGTGASVGVPVIGCHCSVCLSDHPHNKRYRPSGLIEIGSKKILIDVGPDFRTQALTHQIDNIDALFLTHIHSDHIAGVDDVRVFYFRNNKELDCYLSLETFEDLKIRYHYLFRPIEQLPTIPAQLKLHLLEEEFGFFSLFGLDFHYLTYFQGRVKVTGFRVGDLAYLTDIKEYSNDIFSPLQGVNTLIVSALRKESSPVHLSVQEAVAFADRIGAKQAYFTHISHHLDHTQVNKELPKNRQLAYDGLSIDIGACI